MWREAFVHNLQEIFDPAVLIITTIVRDGGSCGALVFGCCHKNIIIGNAISSAAKCFCDPYFANCMYWQFALCCFLTIFVFSTEGLSLNLAIILVSQ